MADSSHRAQRERPNPDQHGPLVPEPKRRTPGGGLVPTTPGFRRAVVRATLSALPEGIRFETGEAMGSDSFRHTLETNDEAYRLVLDPTGIRVIADGTRGRFWAVRTLLQLLRMSPDGSLNAEVIDDWPDLRDRGVLLDVSRTRVPRLETLFALIDLWSRLKVNQLQLYFEHTFAYLDHETVWHGASPFNPEEIWTIDAFCRDRGIDLVPNQNSLGHMERWLRHNAYRSLAECPDGFIGPAGVAWPFGSCLNPADPESARFVLSLFEELLPNFAGRTVNIGGDEPWELGTGRSAEAASGLDRPQLYLRHMRAVTEALHDRGYTVQLYGDVVAESPGILKKLPEDVTILEWGYEAAHPFAERAEGFQALNRSHLLLPGTSSWNAPTGRLQNAQDNTLSAVRAAVRYQGRGILITDWGDNGHTQQLPISIPPWVYAAGVAWGPEDNARMDLAGAVHLHALNGIPSEVARVLIDLGYLHRAEPAELPNASFLGAVLLPGLHPYYGQGGHRFLGASFAEVERKLESIGVQLAGITQEGWAVRSDSTADAPGAGTAGAAPDPVGPAPHAPGPVRHAAGQESTPPNPFELELQSQVVEEVHFTHAYASLGAALCRMVLEWGDGSFGSIPAETRRDLARRLGTLEGEYRERWLARSRPGGLTESLGQFRELRRLLEA